MRRKVLSMTLLIGALLVPIVFFLFNQTTTRPVRGKSPAAPLTDEMSPAQTLAQDLALSDGRVQSYTVGRRSEVFAVGAVGLHFPDSSAACATADCWQVLIYNFDENATVAAIVNADAREVLDVFYQPGIQPGINARLADLAIDLALNDPQVADILGYTPTGVDMAPVGAGRMSNAACAGGHLCVAPTIELREEGRVMWLLVDLTDELLVDIFYTDWVDSPPHLPTEFGGCPAPGAVQQSGWSVNYETTGSDGLRVYDVTYNNIAIIKSAKVVEWHADYGNPGNGFEDFTGCGGSGGFQINPYGETSVIDITDGTEAVIGFEVIQDFRMGNWGSTCNYRYEQHFQFYNDGRFRVVGGAFGKGCGTDSLYKPLIRIDISVAGDDNDTLSRWDGAQWVAQDTEAWWAPGDHAYDSSGYSYVISDTLTGQGYLMELGQGQFGDGGRGDDAYLYAVQHKASEGDADLGTVFDCCFDDHQHGPHLFVNSEDISDTNIVIWYVSQADTIVDNSPPTDYYCWTVSGEPNPETYPCFTGPMFHPLNLFGEALFLPLVTDGQ